MVASAACQVSVCCAERAACHHAPPCAHSLSQNELKSTHHAEIGQHLLQLHSSASGMRNFKLKSFTCDKFGWSRDQTCFEVIPKSGKGAGSAEQAFETGGDIDPVEALKAQKDARQRREAMESMALDSHDAKLVAGLIVWMTSVKEIDLRGNRLKGEGAAAVIRATNVLDGNGVALNLSDNTIGHAGLAEIAAALKGNRSLASLDLSCNGLTSGEGNRFSLTGVVALCEALATTEVAHLSLADNCIFGLRADGDSEIAGSMHLREFAAVAAAAAESPLTTLDLTSNALFVSAVPTVERMLRGVEHVRLASVASVAQRSIYVEAWGRVQGWLAGWLASMQGIGASQKQKVRAGRGSMRVKHQAVEVSL